jgi:hypothetical protein
VFSSDFRNVRATGWAPRAVADLDEWLGSASSSHPLLALEDLLNPQEWPRREDSPLVFASRQELMAFQARVTDDWSQRYPEAAAGDVDDPVADLALAQAMSAAADPAGQHQWLPATLGAADCWICFGEQDHPLHTAAR